MHFGHSAGISLEINNSPWPPRQQVMRELVRENYVNNAIKAPVTAAEALYFFISPVPRLGLAAEAEGD